MLVKKLSLVVLLAASLVSLPAVMGEDGGNEDEAAENVALPALVFFRNYDLPAFH